MGILQVTGKGFILKCFKIKYGGMPRYIFHLDLIGQSEGLTEEAMQVSYASLEHVKKLLAGGYAGVCLTEDGGAILFNK